MKELKLSTLDKIILNLINLDISSQTFTTKDKIFFLKELSTLLKWWVNIVEALNHLKNTNEKAIIRQIAHQLYQWLKKWETLSRSMSRLPQYFSHSDVAIIQAWENSWNLQQVLDYLAKHYKFLFETRKKYISTLIYPIIVILIAIGVIGFISWYVMPAIINLIDNMWFAIPLVTQLLIDTTNFITSYIWYIIWWVFVIIFIFINVYFTEKWKSWIDSQLFEIPIFGKISKYYYLIKYLKYKKLLLSSGMDYISSFQLLKNIIWNNLYQQMIQEQIEEIRKWWSPIEVMKNYPQIIPHEVYTILKVGEESANTSQSIENALEIYNEEFNYLIENLNKLIEPILLIVIWGIVLWIALAIFSLLWTIMDSIESL